MSFPQGAANYPTSTFWGKALEGTLSESQIFRIMDDSGIHVTKAAVCSWKNAEFHSRKSVAEDLAKKRNDAMALFLPILDDVLDILEQMELDREEDHAREEFPILRKELVLKEEALGKDAAPVEKKGVESAVVENKNVAAKMGGKDGGAATTKKVGDAGSEDHEDAAAMTGGGDDTKSVPTKKVVVSKAADVKTGDGMVAVKKIADLKNGDGVVAVKKVADLKNGDGLVAVKKVADARGEDRGDADIKTGGVVATKKVLAKNPAVKKIATPAKKKSDGDCASSEVREDAAVKKVGGDDLGGETAAKKIAPKKSKIKASNAVVKKGAGAGDTAVAAETVAGEIKDVFEKSSEGVGDELA
jgi:hypothetical protein